MNYIHTDAGLSDCGHYRYWLTRVWETGKPACLFIGLNPSTADASQDDPTIRRCVRFAADWGYGTLHMGNLFAFRATDPKELQKADEPIGVHNNMWLDTLANQAGIIIAAWGNNGAMNGRAWDVRECLQNKGHRLHHLGLTSYSQPKHPLYLKATTQPQPWR